jgi:hypothetical protein
VKVLVLHDEAGSIHAVFALAPNVTSATTPVPPPGTRLQLTEADAPHVADLHDLQNLQKLRSGFTLQKAGAGATLVPKRPTA